MSTLSNYQQYLKRMGQYYNEPDPVEEMIFNIRNKDGSMDNISVIIIELNDYFKQHNCCVLVQIAMYFKSTLKVFYLETTVPEQNNASKIMEIGSKLTKIEYFRNCQEWSKMFTPPLSAI